MDFVIMGTDPFAITIIAFSAIIPVMIVALVIDQKILRDCCKPIVSSGNDDSLRNRYVRGCVSTCPLLLCERYCRAYLHENCVCFLYTWRCWGIIKILWQLHGCTVACRCFWIFGCFSFCRRSMRCKIACLVQGCQSGLCVGACFTLSSFVCRVRQNNWRCIPDFLIKIIVFGIVCIFIIIYPFGGIEKGF